MPGRFLGCDALGFDERNALGFEVGRHGGSSLSVRGDPDSLSQIGCTTGGAGALEKALGDMIKLKTWAGTQKRPLSNKYTALPSLR